MYLFLKPVLIFIGVGVLLLTLGPLLLVLVLVALTDDVPPPKIFESLPRQTLEARAEVDRRTKARFHLGTPEPDLIADLEELGFEVKLSEQGRWATYDAPSVVCSSSYSIFWDVNERKVVTDIEGVLNLSCL